MASGEDKVDRNEKSAWKSLAPLARTAVSRTWEARVIVTFPFLIKK
jgi:hypothetical protein